MTRAPPGVIPFLIASRYPSRSSLRTRKWKTARSCQRSNCRTGCHARRSSRSHETEIAEALAAILKCSLRDVEYRKVNETSVDQVVDQQRGTASDIDNGSVVWNPEYLDQLQGNHRSGLEPTHVATAANPVSGIPMARCRAVWRKRSCHADRLMSGRTNCSTCRTRTLDTCSWQRVTGRMALRVAQVARLPVKM